MGVTVLYRGIIVSDPDVFGGRPFIKGTKITVSDVVGFYNSDDENGAAAVADLFNLTAEQVTTALEFYDEHSEKIDAARMKDHHQVSDMALLMSLDDDELDWLEDLAQQAASVEGDDDADESEA